MTVCRAVAEECEEPVINFAGETSLMELTELIRGAQLLVGNETSAIHLAAAVATPAVCILGGGHYGRFLPYPLQLVGMKPTVAISSMQCFSCNWICSQPHVANAPRPCIVAVQLEDVWRSIVAVMVEASAQKEVRGAYAAA